MTNDSWWCLDVRTGRRPPVNPSPRPRRTHRWSGRFIGNDPCGSNRLQSARQVTTRPSASGWTAGGLKGSRVGVPRWSWAVPNGASTQISPSAGPTGAVPPRWGTSPWQVACQVGPGPVVTPTVTCLPSSPVPDSITPSRADDSAGGRSRHRYRCSRDYSNNAMPGPPYADVSRSPTRRPTTIARCR